MIWLIRIGLVLVSSLLMISVIPTLSGWFPTPNLVFAAAIALVLVGRHQHAYLWAGLGGVVLDLTLPQRGFYTLLLVTLVTVIIWVMQRGVQHSSTGLQILNASLAALILGSAELLVSGELWSNRLFLAVVLNVVLIGFVSLCIRFAPASRSHGRIEL